VLAAALEPHGYRLGAPPWVTRDPKAWATAGAAVLAVVVVTALAGRSGITEWSPGASLGGPLLALLVGLAAGVSTCMALVGGLVLAVSAAASARAPGSGDAVTRRAGVRAQLAFTAGRWASFAVGGAALGALGAAAPVPDGVLAAGMLLAAAVMIVVGVRLTGLSPRSAGRAVTLPGRWADRFGATGDRGAAVAGAATFLLPCGFTQAMQLYTASTGSALTGAVVMTAFAVGTTPGLLGLGLLGGLGRRVVWTRAVGVVVVAFALVTATGGLRTLGAPLPSFSSSGAVALSSTEISGNVRMDGGTQVVSLVQASDGYLPAHTVVRAGVPIRWEIEASGGYSCAAALRVPSLGIKADLFEGGRHVLQLPALRPGVTTFRCAMGMYTGTLRAVPAT
jgi:sulfite exporter TauE/SafE